MIYVVQNPQRLDLERGRKVARFPEMETQLRKHGDITFLLGANASIFNMDTVIHDLRNSLKNFSREDHLVLTGNPIFCAMAATIAAEKSAGAVKFLFWAGKDRGYVPIETKL